MIRRTSLALALALVCAAAAASALDNAPSEPPTICAATPALTALGSSLDRVASRIKQGEPLTIVALGSSSTRGIGASSPQLAYPSRLEAELRERLPDVAITVINRGRSGEEVPQMVARLERDVVAAHPDLVIWQLGTNAVLHNDDVSSEREPIARAIARIKQSGSDVVLMDLQYAPKVVARPSYAVMEQLIAEEAAQAHVGLFRRFAIMQQWQAEHPDNPSHMVGRDGLHMTDRGYGCLAEDLADALSASWRPRARLAGDGPAPTLAASHPVRTQSFVGP